MKQVGLLCFFSEINRIWRYVGKSKVLFFLGCWVAGTIIQQKKHLVNIKQTTYPLLSQLLNRLVVEKSRHWQLVRRGRYLEFNLLYDRGVKFGLANVNPRVEGVMVSAPPMIAFEYNQQVKDGSAEDELLQILKKPKDWA